MSDERARRWPEPSPEELLKALRRAGWLLEQETATALDAAGFQVTQSWAYQDPDEGKSRELDVVGYKELFRDADANLRVSAQVIIECKESDMPYALIGRTTAPSAVPAERNDILAPAERVTYSNEVTPEGRRILYVSAAEYLRLHTLTANPWARDFEATQLVRLNKSKENWSASNDGIMQDVMAPLSKVLSILRGEQEAANGQWFMNKSARYSERYPAHLILYFPLVVTSAPLFKVDATNAPAQVTTAPWVTLRRRFNSASLKGTYRATVVNADGLEDYLESQVLGFANAVAEEVAAKPARFVTDRDLSWSR
ncbi:hypothetical protein [Amnibacterium kyonggiense]|uniref:Uncharacterized protein n=1 Tax=Amnibacterium kyonggiense TaxID=595671 RepID=A0A4R7FIS1_9MICO|nr:hypothetical protein [Amnibacterium kyonggiense]TDS74504.1 hypothetical protein CLV52_3687 [Amnibacterium kyonggiense]